jgi:hypothetical protein
MIGAALYAGRESRNQTRYTVPGVHGRAAPSLVADSTSIKGNRGRGRLVNGRIQMAAQQELLEVGDRHR